MKMYRSVGLVTGLAMMVMAAGCQQDQQTASMDQQAQLASGSAGTKCPADCNKACCEKKRAEGKCPLQSGKTKECPANSKKPCCADKANGQSFNTTAAPTVILASAEGEKDCQKKCDRDKKCDKKKECDKDKSKDCDKSKDKAAGQSVQAAGLSTVILASAEGEKDCQKKCDRDKKCDKKKECDKDKSKDCDKKGDNKSTV